MSRNWCVYVTKNHNSGKYYIGKSWEDKVNKGYQGSGTYIKNCKKSNITLTTDIVDVFNSEDMAYRYEEALISQHKKNPLCMNICDDSRPPTRYGNDNNMTRAVIDVDTKEVFTTSSELSKLLEYAGQNQVAVNLSKGIKCRGRTIAWLDEYEAGTWSERMKERNAFTRARSTAKRRKAKRRLAPEEVRQIYYMKNFSDIPQTEICDIFDTSRNIVYRIGKGEIYKKYLPYDKEKK